MKQTVDIETAKKMAEQSGLQAISKAVQIAENDGWDVITLAAVLQADGNYDITADAPTGAMIAWMLPEWVAEKVAIPHGEPTSDLHVTLAYLGKAADLTTDQQRTLIGVVSEVAARHFYMEGHLQGTGRFINGEPTDAFWVGVNIPKLQALRDDLVAAITAAGIPPVGHGATGDYTPHVTVAYLPKDQETPAMVFKPENVSVDVITVCMGPNRYKIALPFPESEAYAYEPGGWAPEVINKAVDIVEEERYTLAPFYIPGRLDAHGEWTDPRDLQKAFHAYLAKEDRGIRLQHNKAITVGKWVSGMVMPHEYTTTLTKANGEEVEHTFPAGTPFLGVEWTEEAWPLVKAGKIRGYSMGGTAKRFLVDLPAEGGE